MAEETTAVDVLYLDAEHFALTAEQQALEPRGRVVPVGRPFVGLLADAGPVRPDEEPTS